MSSKNIFHREVLAGGANDNIEYPVAIPIGKTWVIKEFGAVDQNNGDNKSSVYLLRFGTQEIKAICLSGNTHELKMDYEIIGNGTDKVNVIRKNLSTSDKELAFWIRASERNVN